jgi:hypothetical protein
MRRVSWRDFTGKETVPSRFTVTLGNELAECHHERILRSGISDFRGNTKNAAPTDRNVDEMAFNLVLSGRR